MDKIKPYKISDPFDKVITGILDNSIQVMQNINKLIDKVQEIETRVEILEGCTKLLQEIKNVNRI